MNLKDLHLDECPFGIDMDYDSTERDDLLYEALIQVAYLAKLILWIRCIYRREFIDDHGKSLRKLKVRDLTGNLQSHPDYQKYLSNYHLKEDPLDLSEYTQNLINIYRQIELANGVSHNSCE